GRVPDQLRSRVWLRRQDVQQRLRAEDGQSGLEVQGPLPADSRPLAPGLGPHVAGRPLSRQGRVSPVLVLGTLVDYRRQAAAANPSWLDVNQENGDPWRFRILRRTTIRRPDTCGLAAPKRLRVVAAAPTRTGMREVATPKADGNGTNGRV